MITLWEYPFSQSREYPCLSVFLVLLIFFSLSLIFVILITVYLGMFLIGFILPGTLCFLDLIDCFISHVREVFSYFSV